MPSVASMQTDPRHGRALIDFLHFVWFRNTAGTRVRVVLAVALIGATAALQALAPLIFAGEVDVLSGDRPTAVVLPVSLLVAYGLVFSLGRAFVELRYVALFPLIARIGNAFCSGGVRARPFPWPAIPPVTKDRTTSVDHRPGHRSGAFLSIGACNRLWSRYPSIPGFGHKLKNKILNV